MGFPSLIFFFPPYYTHTHTQLAEVLIQQKGWATTMKWPDAQVRLSMAATSWLHVDLPRK